MYEAERSDRLSRLFVNVSPRVAVDGFGAGFSSLSELAVLPVDVLESDRDFLRGIQTPNGRRIVDAIIDWPATSA